MNKLTHCEKCSAQYQRSADWQTGRWVGMSPTSNREWRCSGDIEADVCPMCRTHESYKRPEPTGVM